MVDYYSLVLASISFVEERVKGKHGAKLQLNKHQCIYMANKLLEVSHSLQNRALENLELVQQDRRVREVLVHLHCSVKRAQVLVERCCPEPSSWLAAAMTLRDIKEEVADILLNVHQWTCMNLDLAITSVKGGPCGNEILNLFITREKDYQRLLKTLQSSKDELDRAASEDPEELLLNLLSSKHELQEAAFQDRKELLERINNFLKTNGDQSDDDCLRAIYLKSQLTHPKGDLQSEEKLKLARPSTPLLGIGASGQVYKENWLGQPVALKELRRVDKEEATLLGQVHHPNVVQFFHSWEVHKGRCPHSFIVMEFMPADLREYIENSSWKSSNMPFSLPVAIDIMLQVAEAMRHLHDRNLMHRDLKTSNILVKPVDESMIGLHNEGYLEVKLADFGSAKAYENSSTSTPLTREVGTKIYGAPEIFDHGEIRRDRHFPPKADVWSFGMTCAAILSGKAPFKGEEVYSLHKRIVEGGLRPTLPADCPQYLKFCISKCWELQPEKRPSFTDLCRLLRYAKILSLGMTLHLDSITSSLFAYETRAGVINVMDINAATLQHCLPVDGPGDKYSWNNNYTLQHSGIAKSHLGDFEGALRDLDAAHKYMPDDCCTLHYRGFVKSELGDLEGAQRDLNAALLGGFAIALTNMDKSSMNYCHTLQRLGIVKMRLGDYAGALKDLDTAAAADEHMGNDYCTLQHRGIVKMKLGYFREALRDLDAALNGQLAEKLRDDVGGADKKSSNPYYTLQQRGMVKLKLDDFKGALKDLDLADEHKPNDSCTLQQRGIVKGKLGNYKGALRDLDAADKHSPNEYCTLRQRGIVKLKLGDYTGALIDLDAADENSRNDPCTMQQRGIVKLKLGDLAGALSDLDAANDHTPGNSCTLQHRGVVKMEMRDFYGAIRDLDAALELNEHGFFIKQRIVHLRGVLKDKMGDPEGALKDLECGYLCDPDILCCRATVKEKLGDLQGALKDLNEANEIHPNQSSIPQHRAIIRHKFMRRVQKFNTSGLLRSYSSRVRPTCMGGGDIPCKKPKKSFNLQVFGGERQKDLKTCAVNGLGDQIWGIDLN